MASDRILALNIGSGQITLGEFKIAAGKKPLLMQYGTAPLGLDPDSEMDPSGFIIAALSDIMKETGIKPGPLMMSVSGQAVFPRFVKLPSVAKDKLYGMVKSEAEQNVPFPIEELTWDYQLIGEDDAGEQNAMIVAAKTESIAALTNAVVSSELEPEVVDVAPLAVYNCVRQSYPDLSGCAMVLDIGSRSTNLVFIEEGKVFYRSIPVAGNTITHEIAKTFQIDFRAAEQMKRESGFVALGGVTGVEDEDIDRMSKCIRSVVTRLHAEVNRSINFYRSQQGGSVPTRVFLTGGSSILQELDVFFTEKLKVEVEFLNPYSAIDFGSKVNSARLESDFYELAEVVGMAVRRAGMAKVEINLMPPNLVEKKLFRKRIPFFVVAAVTLIGASFFAMLRGNIMSEDAASRRQMAESKRNSFNAIEKKINAAKTERDAVVAELDQYRDLIAKRRYIAKWFDSIRAAMPAKGMWLVSVEPTKDGASLEIVFRGFDDVLKKLESSNNGKPPPIVFGNKLSTRPEFGAFDEQSGVKLTRHYDDDIVTEYKILIPIKEEFRINKAKTEE